MALSSMIRVTVTPPMALWMLSLLIALFSIIYVLYNLYIHPLRHVPGPWYAAASPLYYLYSFLRGHQHLDTIVLHERYGPIVRMAPNNILINSPTYFPAYFNYDKSVWWRAFRAHPIYVSHSNELSIPAHKAQKKRIMGAYQMSVVLKDESKMDKHIASLERQFRVRLGQAIDFSPWAVWIAFDIVMDMVFSSPLGFVEAAYDVDGVCGTIQGLISGAVVVATFPWLSRLILNRWIHPLIAPKPTDTSGPGRIHGMAYEQVRKRFNLLQQHQSEQKPNDVLQKIIDKVNADGEHLPREVIEQEAVNPIIAGSDSTAVQIRTAILYLSTHPVALNRLRAEIDAADTAGQLSPIAQYNEIRTHIPYMEAIQNELLRIYPVVGAPLPRAAPEGGVTMHDYFIPAGTDISISQWAFGRNKDVFGDDVHSFRPERWEFSSSSANNEAVDPDFDETGTILGSSESKSSSSTKQDEFVRRMRTSGAIFFSSGPMMCTGRHIAIMEVFKIIVHLFRTFDFQIVDPVRPWKELNRLAMLHRDFWVIINERHK